MAKTPRPRRDTGLPARAARWGFVVAATEPRWRARGVAALSRRVVGAAARLRV